MWIRFELWAGVVADRTFGNKTTHLPLRHARHHLHVPTPPVLLSPPPLLQGAAAMGPAISRNPGCDCQHPMAFEPLAPWGSGCDAAESQNWWKTDGKPMENWRLQLGQFSSFPWSQKGSQRNSESLAQCCPRNQEWWLVAAVSEDVAAQVCSRIKTFNP